MADTMLHQSHPLAVLAAGLLAEPHQEWGHLAPLVPGRKRRRLADVVITAHPDYPVRAPTWRLATRHFPTNSR